MSAHQLDHPLRSAMVAELHARPFLRLRAPCRLAYMALKPLADDVHSPELARQQLVAFLDLFDMPAPAEGAVYHFANLGKATLKWESHSEFATYTLFDDGGEDSASDDTGSLSTCDQLHDLFAQDWLSAFPAKIATAISVDVLQAQDQMAVEHLVQSDIDHRFGFPSNHAISYVTEKGAAIAGDFLLDDKGRMNFVVVATQSIGPGRTGRAVQRLLEVETYRAMSMLTLPVARDIMGKLTRIDRKLADTVGAIGDKSERSAQTLDELMKITAELAVLSTQSSFRFSAAAAYDALVRQRLELLNEERLLGRQLFSEFLTRRYAPTMRTCRSAKSQLDDVAERASNAADLLSTRVSVTNSAQNRQLLARMDDRAAQQARLQETVEGISVVAISYYAVSLLTYLLTPLTKILPISKTMLAASLVIPVAALVWFGMHRLKEKLIRKPKDPQKE